MSQSTEAQNKATVLEAFDTLFNKRDYVAAARFWSLNYVQHSAHIEPGRDGLFNLIKGMPPTFKHEHEQIVADGEYVIVHSRFRASARPRTGSLRTSFVWSMDSWSSIGTWLRTKRRRPNPRAVGRCSASGFRCSKTPDEPVKGRRSNG